MIHQADFFTALNKHRGEAIVLPTMQASIPWQVVSEQPDLDLPVNNVMGKASSVGLGVALARPQTKVIILDGDGSLEMNLGSLITIAGKQPKNLCHVVMQNGIYGMTGGQPIPASERVSFATMAKGAGYAATYEFDDLEDLTTRLGEALGRAGPVFVTVKIVPNPRTTASRSGGKPPPRIRSTGAAIAAFRGRFAK